MMVTYLPLAAPEDLLKSRQENWKHETRGWKTVGVCIKPNHLNGPQDHTLFIYKNQEISVEVRCS